MESISKSLIYEIFLRSVYALRDKKKVILDMK